MREQAHAIQAEVRLLVEDVGRLRERTAKLAQHFRQAQEDVAQVLTSADKIGRRGGRIDNMDFNTAGTAGEATEDEPAALSASVK